MLEEKNEERVPLEDYGQQQPPGKPAPPRRRPRRASPLGLMGTPDDDLPKESGLPSRRAIGFMLLFIALVIAVIYFFTR